MELRHYIRVKRRWLIPLVVVPVLAAGTAAWIVHSRPEQSTAEVQLSAPAGTSNSEQAIGLYVAKLSQALTVDSVLEQVAKESSVPASTLSGAIGVSRIGNSDQADVTVTTPDGDARTETAAKAAARAGILYVATHSDDSQQALTLAQGQLDQAQKALFAFEDQIGMLDPSATYQQVTSALHSAQAQLAAAQATGDVAGAARLQAQIGVYQQQQGQLVPSVRQFDQLQAAVSAATNRVNTAQAQVLAQQTRVSGAQNGGQIVQASVSTAGRMRPILEAAGLAAVLAFLVVLGISLLPDLFRRQRVEPSTDAAASSHAIYDSPNGNVASSGKHPPVVSAAPDEGRNGVGNGVAVGVGVDHPGGHALPS